MFHEEKISSFPLLVQELDRLDMDAGVRTFGKYNSKKCLVFMTKSFRGFVAALYSVRTSGKDILPDKRLLVKEFAGIKELENFLGEVIEKPVRAFAY